jgi:hypothetical protein
MQNKKLRSLIPAILLAAVLLTLTIGVFADGYTDAELAELAAAAGQVDTVIVPVTQNQIVCTVGQPADYYFSDFENDDGGWAVSSSYDEWEWGTIVPGVQAGCDTTRPLEPTTAYSGVNVWATDLDGCYDNVGDETILSQTFDLSSLAAPVELSWWNWYEVFVSFDKAEVYVDGTLLWEVTTTAATADWTQEAIDLSAYAGDPDVTIDFRLYSTTVVNRLGWYLDNVAITHCETPPPTAVELTAFSADVNPDGSVTVNWETSAEINSAGFNVYRSDSATWDATAALLTPQLIASQSVNGSGANYSFADAPDAGVWHYYLEEVDLSGATQVYGPVTAVTQAPTSTALTNFGGNTTNMTMLLIVAGLSIVVLAAGAALYRRQDA